MKIDLKKYMNNRDDIRISNTKPGPIVTISRQYGCPANQITVKLLHRIAELNDELISESNWKYISKEIIEDAAAELNLPVMKLEKRLSDKTQNMMEVFSGFSQHYSIRNDRIIDTLKSIMDTYVLKGKLIILGRGGAALNQHVKDALHIRLIGSRNWRAMQIMESKSLDLRTALQLVDKVDEERLYFTEKISDRKFGKELFHVVFNCEKLSESEIVDSIIRLMLERKLVRIKELV